MSRVVLLPNVLPSSRDKPDERVRSAAPQLQQRGARRLPVTNCLAKDCHGNMQFESEMRND